VFLERRLLIDHLLLKKHKNHVGTLE